MDLLAWSDSLKERYLSQISDELRPVTKSILYSFKKYEMQFGVPLHYFTKNQYEISMNGWAKKSTFFSNRTRVGKYLEWLELERIPTTIGSFQLVKYTSTQLFASISTLFRNLQELYDAIYSLYFAGEEEYSSTVQEGTVIILKMLGLSNWEISQLKEEDILFDRAEIKFENKTISEIPEEFLELIGICMDLKGRYARNMYTSKTLTFENPANARYLIKQIKLTENRDDFFIGNMMKRATRIWKESAYGQKRSIMGRDICHSYLFCRLHQYEKEHPFKEEFSEEQYSKVAKLIEYWSVVRLNSLTMKRNFFYEYVCWRAIISRE